jgi:transposase
MTINETASGSHGRHVRRGHIAYIAAEIKRTEVLIRDQIDNHPTLKQQSELLDSIPGIGRTTAALLLAEIVDVTQ